MAKQLNVSLAFNADTTKARQQIQELQKSLNDLIKHSVQNSSTGDMPITKQLTEAQVAASKLQTILTQSVNMKTGNLDLTKFSQSLDQSGLKLTTLKNQLDLLGPSGQKAFVSLAQSIVTADVPLARTSKLLNEMWTTMKNTVRWQLSSSILHGVIGAYQSAMGYAKDLDESLNNIRIVTGQGVDEMARFAEQANKAAKALSTTTTEYTKASLIYYQQGLNDTEVAKRTEVTVKMANAAGQSAQVVSDQLTAVWNNFYDGSKSLEYYADVMTALGAATASSTDEIAGGLEKFAAIGKTIGLSYEYAASALATITANTRESEEVVGTALKTIFARIQGLNLGETLEDGVTLNKYSEALQKVGISIFDSNGELKKMDNILDELGTKWETLNKSQQVALAQTVAGVRQYNQLIALMDNWDRGDSDSMKANLNTAYNATGTLQEQADIYAQSWEAARDRVKAATEDLFDSIIDEEFFITILNGFEDLLSGVANFTDAINGLPGILSLLGVIMSRVFSKQITESVNNLAFTVESLTGKTKKNADELQQQALEMAKNINFDTGTEAGDREGQAMQNRLDLQQQIKEISSNLTQEEQQQLVKLLEINDAYAEQAILAAKAKDAASQKTSEANAEIRRKVSRNEGKDGAASMSDYKAQYAAMQELATQGAKAAESLNKVNNALKNKKDATSFGNEIEEIALHLERVNRPQGAANLRKLFDDFKNGKVSAGDFKIKLREVVVAEELLQDTSITMSDGLYDITKGSQVTQGECDALADRMIELAQATLTSDNANTAYQKSVIELKNSIAGFHGALDSFGTNVTKTMQGISSLAMAASSLKSAFDTLKNPDLSFGEKLLQVTMSLSMAIPALITGLKALNAEQLKKNAADLKAIGIGAINLVQTGMRTAGAWGEAIANQGVTASLWKQVAAWIAVHIAALPVSVVILLIVAALAAFVAIVAGVVLAANALADAHNADANAAKEASEQVKVLTERYEELKNKAQELNDAIADYQDARNALADLEKGTDEYAEALENANQKARDLIETYGLWDQYEYKDGLITFKDGALEQAQQKADDAANQAQVQMYQGNIYSNQASLRDETTNVRRFANKGYGSITNEETQIIAEVATELKESLGGVTPTAEQLIARLEELGISSGLDAQTLANLSGVIDSNTVPKFLSLGESMSEAEKANRYYAEQILGMAIEDEYGDKITTMATDKDGNVDESKYNQILTAFTNRAAALEEQKGNDITAKYNEVESKVKDIVNTGDLNSFLDKYENDTDSNKLINDVVGGNYDGKINNDEELGLLYAQMISGINKNELTYKAGNGVGTVKDKEGNEIVSGVSDEVMRREIAKQVAMQQITNDYADSVDGNDTSLEQLENALNALITGASKVEKDFGVDFSSTILDTIANKDFDSLDFSGLFSELDPEEMARLSGLDSQGILDLLGLDTPTLQALGYDVNTFTTAFSNALDNWTYTVDTTDIEEKAASLKEIADDIKVGDIIDQEAYDRLNAAGINTNRYFTQMEDGTYKLTGAAREFQNAVENITVQDYINKIKEFESAQQYAETQIGQKYGMANAANVSKTNIVGSDTVLGAARADYINTFEGDFGFTDDQLTLLNKDFSQYTTEDLQELANMVDIVNSKSVEMQSQMLSTADSLDELNNRVNLANLEGIGINYDAYSKGLLDLASSYENCTKEMERYQLALANGNQEELYAAECTLKASIRIGEATEAYDLSAESLEAQSRELMIANGWSEEYAETAAQMAISNQRMNRGVEKLAKNWKDWSKILKSTDTTSQDYADILVELSDAVGDLVGWYDDLSLSSKFVNQNMELIEKASQGNVNAIIQLGAAVANYEVEQARLNETLVEGRVKTETGLATNALQAYIDKLGEGTTAEEAFKSAQVGIQEGFDLIANNLDRLNNGVSLADVLGGPEALQTWIEQLNAYASATGMTAQQMQAMLSSVGVTANVQTDYQEQEVTVPTYREQVTNVTYRRMPYQTLGLDGQTIFTGTTTIPEYTKAQVPGPPLTTTGFVEVASISMDGIGEAPGVPAPTFTGRQAPSKSAVSGGNTGGGGGSSSAPKEPSKATKIDTTNKNEIVERYKEVNDALDDLADQYEKASRSADRLWGENRLDAIREQNKLIEEQQELLKEKQRQAEDYMNQDRAALNQAAAEAGLSFSYDDKGNITNYTDQMTNLYNQLAAAEAHYNSLATGEDQDAYEETILEPLRDKIKAIEDAIEIYEESKELFEELGLDIEDLQDQIMQNNYDIIMEGLELHISFNEEDLENIDYYLSKLEDDFYSMAEAAALMVGADGNSQLNEYLSNLEEYSKAMDDLHKAYANGEITEAAYQEGLKEIRGNIRDNLSSLLELDKAMMEYYGETLAMAQEELAKYTDRMQQQTEVLQHYGNMMEILGKQLDYDSMGVILQGQVDTIENEMNVAEAAYNMYKQQVEEKRALYEEAMENNDFTAAELYKKEWEVAQEAADEAQSEMLSKTEEWSESMRAVVENKLAGLAKSLEEALTGGTSFDQINLQLERAVSLQEEYLTTTNQIYEINKLMRTAQQAIDKSTNSVAKQRLKDFIKETDQLQDKAKLSQYELEIQQAKYNLLLAEIALEDAQNAKSTVRLQRDSEGNFGYVYTADQTQLAQAQQELEDAQNSLYNIGLEGAGNYTEKYTQTMQEMYDTLTSITEAYYNGEITSQEDYEAQMLAAQEYYYQQLENYQGLYGIALQTDTRVIQDSWTSSFRTMINNTENWKIKVNDYSVAAGQSLSDWYSKVEEISQKTGLDNIANNVKKVTDESKALRDIVLGTEGEPGVINALQQELKEVSDLTRQYATFRTTLQGVITEYEKLINAANRLAEANARAGVNNSLNNSGSSSSNSNNASSSNNTNDLSSSGGSSGGTQTANKYKATYNLRGKSNTISGYYSEGAARAAAESAINSAINALTGITFSEKNDIAAAARRSIQIARYNTGGYTGSWGPYGKLGILDEKELILNPEDTENFLASMKVLEHILEIIDLQAVSSQLGGTLSTPSIGNSITSQSLEQSVHIEASFPSVQDRNEIEEAFNTLINKASQYANRK